MNTPAADDNNSKEEQFRSIAVKEVGEGFDCVLLLYKF